jgi:hypothetical protein
VLTLGLLAAAAVIMAVPREAPVMTPPGTTDRTAGAFDV